MNGNNFFSKTEVTADTFRGELGRVVITGDAEADEAGLIGEHSNLELVQIAHYTQKTHGLADVWYFVPREIPPDKFEMMRLAGNIDYIAMMTGVIANGSRH